MLRKIKRLLSMDEYRRLDKNTRVDPDGQIVPVRDEQGRELPDPVPLAPPVGWFKQPSMFDQVRQMVRSEHLRMYAEAQGDESFDEANDFDVDEDNFPRSQYEGEYLTAEEFAERRQAEFREAWLRERERREMENDVANWDGRTVAPPPSRKALPKGAQAEPGRDEPAQD